MSKHQQQADSEIHEDQLLSFLIKPVDEEVALDLSNNAEIDAEDVHEVPSVVAPTGPRSRRCATSAKTRHRRTRSYTIFERVANTLLRRNIVELLPEQVGVCTDLHLRPYYGDEDKTDRLYHSEAKRGTTAFHGYATLCARVKKALHRQQRPRRVPRCSRWHWYQSQDCLP